MPDTDRAGQGPEDEAAEVLHAPARVVAFTQERAAAELTALVQGSSLDPSVLEEFPPFFLTAQASNSRIDAYTTVMEDSTLQNFAKDATAGVGLQNSHVTRELGFGRSIAGRFVGKGGNGLAHCDVDFFMLRGLNLNGVNTSDVIVALRAGILKDVSVGFFGGLVRCSICGRDMNDWSWLWSDGDDGCMHFPGETYKIKDKDGGEPRDEMAVGHIEDAHLAEVSIVYKGATPGAGIVSVSKARSLALSGRIPEARVHSLEQRYRIHLPGPRRVWTAAHATNGTLAGDPTPSEEQSMPTTKAAQAAAARAARTAEPTEAAPAAEAPAAAPTGTPAPAEPTSLTIDPAEDPTRTGPAASTENTEATAETADLAPLVEALTEAGEGDAIQGENVAERIAEAIRRIHGRAQANQAAADEVETLRSLAADGTTLRERLITETLQEGVRAVGQHFAEEPWRTFLSDARTPVSTILGKQEEWRELARANFPGGRKTRDTAEKAPAKGAAEKGSASDVPDAAFRARPQ